MFLKRLFLFPLPGKSAAGRREGVILITAIGAIAVLSILVIGTSSAVVQQLKLAKYITDADTSYYPALSAIEVMKAFFDNDATPQQVVLYDLRGRRIPLDGKIADITVKDEQALFNLYRGNSEMLARLPGLKDNAVLAQAIEAAGKAIEVKEDIFLLEGATRESYDSLKDKITLFGVGVVNLNTAYPETLYALGMDDDLITKIVEFRSGEDGQEGTEDDGYFDVSANIVTSLGPYSLNSEQITLLNNLVASGFLTTTSNFIRLSISIEKSGKRLASYDVVMNLNTGKIVRWQEA